MVVFLKLHDYGSYVMCAVGLIGPLTVLFTEFSFRPEDDHSCRLKTRAILSSFLTIRRSRAKRCLANQVSKSSAGRSGVNNLHAWMSRRMVANARLRLFVRRAIIDAGMGTARSRPMARGHELGIGERSLMGRHHCPADALRIGESQSSCVTEKPMARLIAVRVQGHRADRHRQSELRVAGPVLRSSFRTATSNSASV